MRTLKILTKDCNSKLSHLYISKCDTIIFIVVLENISYVSLRCAYDNKSLSIYCILMINTTMIAKFTFLFFFL